MGNDEARMSNEEGSRNVQNDEQLAHTSFVILPLPASKSSLQPVDKTRYGREETTTCFRCYGRGGFFGLAFDGSAALRGASRHRDRQYYYGQHGKHWAPGRERKLQVH